MQTSVRQALVHQISALLLCFLLVQLPFLPQPGLLAIAALQGLLASFLAAAFKAPRWWIAIHLVFFPALVLFNQLSIPPIVFGAGFLILLGLYWTTFRTQVPLFFSNRAAVFRLAAEMDDTQTHRVLDAGCGIGSFSLALAQARPDWLIEGIELAPAPVAIAFWRARIYPNLQIHRRDLWHTNFAPFDVVYAFLSPVPMPDLWKKARREMKPGATLISNSFPIPDIEPDSIIVTDDHRDTRLYCYTIPQGAGAQKQSGTSGQTN